MIGVKGHNILNAQRFMDVADLWLVIGRSTAWPDDENPEVPDVAATEVTEVIGAKVATAQWVYRDDASGTEVFLSNGVVTRWTIVTTLEDAITNDAHHVLVSSVITGTELPLDTFREIGVYSGLEATAITPSGQDQLLPTEIEDYGTLELIEYRKPVSRDSSSAYEVDAIIEF